MDASPLVACTFDCYGTLIDWEGGLGAFLYDFALRQRGDRSNGRELRERWEAIQFGVIQGEYVRYSDALAESLRLLSQERAWSYSDEDGKALARSMRSWQPFPDTGPALRRAHEAGLRLIIVSNTDRDILEHSVRQMEVPIDAAVTAEDVGSYKPALGHWERFFEATSADRDTHVHVGASLFHDIAPARELGLRTVWINRLSEIADPEPDRELTDLSDLPDTLDELVEQ